MSRAPRQAAPLALASTLPRLQHLTPPADLPCFELTYICNGRTFKSLARGRNAVAASYEGIIALAEKCQDFDADQARLTAAIQVQS